MEGNLRDAEEWLNKGINELEAGKYEEALTSCDQALAIKPDYYHAWNSRGNALKNLGRHDEALTCYDQALAIKPDYYYAWNNRGLALHDLGRGEEALTCYDQALAIKPDYYNAWNNRGLALHDLGRHDEAFTCYDQALAIKPDYYNAWNSRGAELYDLGHDEEALTSCDQALAIKPDYYNAWNNRGNALRSLERYEEALTSFNHALKLTDNQFWKAWGNRGWAIYISRGYKEALQNWSEGLQSIQSDTREYQKGCGVLHQYKGNASYYQGKLEQNPNPYWRDAYRYYQQALKFLTTRNLRQQRLEVLQDTIQVCRALDKTTEVQALLAEGTDLLGRLLQDTPSATIKIRLSRKFASFNQLRVDQLAQSGNSRAALELAEERKNLCLGWMLNRWSNSAYSPNYTQMQKLLQPAFTLSRGKDGQISVTLPTGRKSFGKKAIVFWHISPVAITTFVVKYNQPPIVVKNDLTPPAPLPCEGREENEDMKEKTCSPLLVGEGQGERSSYSQLREFEQWLETWKRSENLREEMPEHLKKLAKILNIEAISSHLKGIKQLILIPHRDLHLLPLHALFPDNFTSRYLPSIKVGCDRQNPTPNTSILSIENPTNDLQYAPLESQAICQLYPNAHRLTASNANKTAVKIALAQNFGIFHFTGHGTHNLEQPAESALILANNERLTLKDILELNLSSYNLACLSSCETNFTSKVGLIDEFIGLGSGFVAAGTNNVIGSLWKVDDCSTAYLMTKFHEIIKRSANKNVPSALKEAQEWLRNATNAELEQFPLQRGQTRDFGRLSDREIAENRSPDHKPYDSPYYWAGFCAIGL